MKMKRIMAGLIGAAALATLASCGSESKTTTAETTTVIPATTTPAVTTTQETPVTEVTTTEALPTTTEDTPVTETEAQGLAYYKNLALEKLDSLINPLIEKIPDDEVKTLVQQYYDREKQYINDITDLETAKGAALKVEEDTKAFAMDEVKSLVITRLNAVINPLIEKIPDDDLKTSLKEYYATEMTKLDDAKDLESLITAMKEIKDDTQAYIHDQAEALLTALKNKALDELDPYVTALIEKIPFDTLKTDTQSFYETEKEKLYAVDEFEDIDPTVSEIKADMESYALTEAKKLALAKLKETVDAGLAKMPNETLKADLSDFADEEYAKLNAITKLEDVKTTLETVIEETEAHVKNLLITTVKGYLQKLSEVETATAYDYLPAAMAPSYSANLVSESDIAYDFTSDTSVSSIKQAGYGEQWQMVIENINQSVTLAKIFNTVQTVMSSATQAVNIYIENSYADSISYSFSGENYTGDFSYADYVMTFNITMTESVEFPAVGTVKPVIRMEYDLTKEAKGLYLSLGDSYKLKYVISDDVYEMATTYGLSVGENTGSRSSYLSISKDNGTTTGHIYEYTTWNGSDKIQACADFYCDGTYVSVVGNKASGMTGFDGYISELYLASQGRLLGYEVREELTYAGVTGTYNTLWFNLWDISGISSVKVTDKTDANSSGKSTCDTYLNGSSSLLVPTYNTKLTVKTSRKYDVELRNRYYYTYDSENDKYVSHEVEVPMFFIQEGDNYSSFISDFSKANGFTVAVGMNSTYLAKEESDYDTLIDVFITNKDNMSSDAIIEYLNKYDL